ncbi:hypothetical protein V8G54_037136 [Vigna mungo]|uniref:Uncharacterized protein n=1 Tax=Vigna mungo TaxID=3915 RepID=A0AAQ3MIB7_VIGMU
MNEMKTVGIMILLMIVLGDAEISAATLKASVQPQHHDDKNDAREEDGQAEQPKIFQNVWSSKNRTSEYKGINRQKEGEEHKRRVEMVVGVPVEDARFDVSRDLEGNRPVTLSTGNASDCRSRHDWQSGGPVGRSGECMSKREPVVVAI